MLIAMLANCRMSDQKTGYIFDGSGITRDNLENYLGKAVTMAEFLTVDPFCNDAAYPDKERDIKLIQNIGAKFIGRSIYRWGGEEAFNNPDFLDNAKILVAKVHENDPDVIFQAALFEAVSSQVNNIKIPEWVFAEFSMSAEQRNFCWNLVVTVTVVVIVNVNMNFVVTVTVDVVVNVDRKSVV